MAEGQSPQNPGQQPTGNEAGRGKEAPETGAAKSAKTQSGSQDAIAMLKDDHRKVEQLFDSYEKARSRSQKAELAETICTELKIHTALEEGLFYPAARKVAHDDRKLDEAQVEHDCAKELIAELQAEDPGAPYYDAKVKVLGDYVRHHIGEEEAPDGILAQAQKGGVDVKELGERMVGMKERLKANADQIAIEPVSLGHAYSSTKEKPEMPRYGNEMRGQGRDDQGRFTGGSRGYDDDDRGRRSRGSDDDGRYGRGRQDDDDDGRGRGRGGHGGWFGDSEGHSEASRRGWDDRGGSRSQSYRGRDDDDRGRGHGGWFGDPEGHSEASRRGWDDERHGRSGWFGDPEGHSEASRRGWDDERHGRSGWFGDPDGHSEASRRGWDDRGGSRSRGNDDDRRSSRSSRMDDDDRGRDDRGRGRGGWFGDPRGHSEAARRGWEDRR